MMTNTASLDDLRRQLAELDALKEQGVLTGEAARAAREDLERRIVAAVTGQGPAAPAAAAPVTAAPRVSMRLKAGIAAFAVVFGLVGYTVHGDWSGWKVGPPDASLRAQGGDAAGQGGQPEQAQIEAMVAALAERMKESPDDPEGWQMLGRSYAALGRNDEAVTALRRVVELKPGDAQALADLADAVGVANGRSLDGEPERLIEQAMKADPNNVKALALGGTIAFNRERYPRAVELWERAVKNAGSGGEFARQLQGAIDEARRRGGMPAAAPVATPAPAADAKPAATAPAAAGASKVSGRVELAPALRDKVAAGDTVYVFARPADGQRIPLATVRRGVDELPFAFTLDDSQAMSDEARLSAHRRVIVGARISKSGDPIARPGDLQGFSQPVDVGTGDLRIVIDETVR